MGDRIGRQEDRILVANEDEVVFNSEREPTQAIGRNKQVWLSK